MRVAIVGQGYVGLTLAMGASNAGHQVVGIDSDVNRVTSLNGGKSHVEGISDSEILSAIGSGSYQATSKYEEIFDCEIVVIAVPTPLDDKGSPDLSILLGACDDIAPFLNANTLVINESTSYVGTLRNLILSRIQANNKKVKLFAVSPERVDPGNTTFRLENTPRLVGGLTPEASYLARNFYSTFCKDVVITSSPEVAEAAKLLENTFRFINIGFVNEFTQLMNKMQIPALEVIEAASTKPYGFMKFTPNVGIGGHCIPVDPMYLQLNWSEVGESSDYIEVSENLNSSMSKYAIERLEGIHGSLKGLNILVVGVSYKPNVSDTRESPAKSIITHLRNKGANVQWHDPIVSQFMGIESTRISDEFDLALVLVAHDDLDMSNWGDKPIYSVNFHSSQPHWVPILGDKANG
mgnify:CR=1 FL=1